MKVCSAFRHGVEMEMAIVIVAEMEMEMEIVVEMETAMGDCGGDGNG